MLVTRVGEFMNAPGRASVAPSDAG
jgi:hypothetical protein